MKLYDDILPVESLKDKSKVKIILTPGDRFRLKGYRVKKYVTWVAIKIFNGPEVIYGYFMVPEKLKISTFWATVGKVIDSKEEPSAINIFRKSHGHKLTNTKNVFLKLINLNCH